MKTKTRTMYPENIKRQAVLDFESGNFTLSQVMEKYEIKWGDNVRIWAKKYKSPEKEDGRRTRIDMASRKRAVLEIVQGFSSIEEIAERYERTKNCIKKWFEQYSAEVLTEPEALPNEEVCVELPMTKEEKQRFKEMEKALKAEKMKVLTLETMIDIAEKKYKLEIRKKSGSKQ
ncbi:hypothetical protein D3C87_262120 [compost metagenome]